MVRQPAIRHAHDSRYGTPILSPGPVGAYPGFQGIAAGPGGPTWGIANGVTLNNLAQYGQVNALTGGALNIPPVTQAFINASPGGVAGLGTANLATLAPLQQGLVGNFTSGRRIAGVDRQQSAVGGLALDHPELLSVGPGRQPGGHRLRHPALGREHVPCREPVIRRFYSPQPTAVQPPCLQGG